MTLFLKKTRPQTDFYLSLLNCVYFYFSFLWGFPVFLTCPFLELWNVFVQFVLLRTFYIRRKRQFFLNWRFSTYIHSLASFSSSSRFSMLFRLMYRVDVL